MAVIVHVPVDRWGSFTSEVVPDTPPVPTRAARSGHTGKPAESPLPQIQPAGSPAEYQVTLFRLRLRVGV